MLDTKRRRESEEEEDTRLDRFVEILQEFPADIAKHVAMTWFRRPPPDGVFTPTPAEIYHECERLTLPRRMIAGKLREAIQASQT